MSMVAIKVGVGMLVRVPFLAVLVEVNVTIDAWWSSGGPQVIRHRPARLELIGPVVDLRIAFRRTHSAILAQVW
jgi:hypothetical protein